jgi:hypothetical protein
LGGVKLGGSIRFPSKETLYERLFQTGQGVEVRLHPKRDRHTEAWFKTKKEAKEAEARKRQELKNPSPVVETPTDMAFLDVVNEYLDNAKREFAEKTYKYEAYVYQQFLKFAGDITAREITIQRIEAYLRTRPANPQLRDVMASLEEKSHTDSHTQERPMEAMSHNSLK